LLCITDKPLTYFGGVYLSEVPHTLTFVGNPPVAFLDPVGVSLSFSQKYQIIGDASTESYRVRTRGYMYHVNNEHGEEIFAYHWHPDIAGGKIKFPHLHFRKGALIKREELTKTHMPSGRVAIESLVEYLIDEFGVRARVSDYRKLLERNRNRFEAFKNW
jgi:hypothetical protein